MRHLLRRVHFEFISRIWVMLNYEYMIIWVHSNTIHLINRIKPINLNTIRLICTKLLLLLVKEVGIKPLKSVGEDPSKYFAILEATESVDM